MWKSLLAFSVAVLAGIAPVAVQSQEMPRSFEDTVKLILFGDPTKSESAVEEVFIEGHGIKFPRLTLKIILSEIDAKDCTATVINEFDEPGYGQGSASLVVNFKAVTRWSTGGYGFVLNSTPQSPVFKSMRAEWLRIDTARTKEDKEEADKGPLTCFTDCGLASFGKRERTEQAMNYMTKTICPNPNIGFGPSTKF